MKHKIRTPFGTAILHKQGPAGESARIMVTPGYSESITHNKRLIHTLADMGYTAFTFSQPRSKGTMIDVLERQKHIIMSVLDSTLEENEKVHAVTHSFGAAALLKAAKERPELFADLILMQPSGLAGEQSFPELVRRVSRKTRTNHLYALKRHGERSVALPQVALTHLSSSKVIARNPLLALREARLAIRHAITDDIAAVKSLGVPVHVVTVHKDDLFDMNEAGLGYDQLVALQGSYMTIADKTARHDTFWLQPERTARIVDGLVKQTLQTASQNK